jgi:hypothetical protein
VHPKSFKIEIAERGVSGARGSEVYVRPRLRCCVRRRGNLPGRAEAHQVLGCRVLRVVIPPDAPAGSWWVYRVFRPAFVVLPHLASVVQHELEGIEAGRLSALGRPDSHV